MSCTGPCPVQQIFHFGLRNIKTKSPCRFNCIHCAKCTHTTTKNSSCFSPINMQEAPFIFHKSQFTDLNLLSMSTQSHTAPWFNVDHRRTLHLSFTNLNPPISICYQCRPRRTLHLGSMSTTVRHCTFLSVVKYQQHQFEPRWLVLNFIFTRPRATFNPNRRTRFQLVLFRVR